MLIYKLFCKRTTFSCILTNVNENPINQPENCLHKISPICVHLYAYIPNGASGQPLSFSQGCVTGAVSRWGRHVTHFQIMAGFCLPSLLRQTQFANSSIHLQTNHASVALCSLITPKLPWCTLNNCFHHTNLFQSPTMPFILCIKFFPYLSSFHVFEPPMITVLWQRTERFTPLFHLLDVAA